MPIEIQKARTFPSVVERTSPFRAILCCHCKMMSLPMHPSGSQPTHETSSVGNMVNVWVPMFGHGGCCFTHLKLQKPSIWSWLWRVQFYCLEVPEWMSSHLLFLFVVWQLLLPFSRVVSFTSASSSWVFVSLWCCFCDLTGVSSVGFIQRLLCWLWRCVCMHCREVSSSWFAS